tara:strand:+ start:34 stop:441 length:408 start_codon:yes stop_codon:yes gene_type:complete
MTAIGLLKGDLVAEDYEDDVAADPRVDSLRKKMIIKEDKRYSEEYLEADKRSIANSIQIYFKDGSFSKNIEVEYPIGHKRRRNEGIPILLSKFKKNLETRFDQNQVDKIVGFFSDFDELQKRSVNDFMTLFVTKR